MLISVATFAFGIGLLLWRHAQSKQQQTAMTSFVEQQINEQRHTLGDTTDNTYEPTIHSNLHPAVRAWQNFMLRAGVDANMRFMLLLLLPGVFLIVFAALLGGLLSAIFTAFLYITLNYFRLWLKVSKRHQKIVHQLPAFLDTMVRLTIIGNSLESAFQSTLLTTDAPLRELFERANRMVNAGMELEHALVQQARVFQVVELELIGAVIGIALRFGGRADTVLERMAAFMRDREQAQNELSSLSTEIRLSAWVLALLPIAIGSFMIIFNNKMFSMMWADPLGKNMLIIAFALEIIGAYWLYRLAKSV